MIDQLKVIFYYLILVIMRNIYGQPILTPHYQKHLQRLLPLLGGILFIFGCFSFFLCNQDRKNALIVQFVSIETGIMFCFYSVYH
jgi:hypothetical protein